MASKDSRSELLHEESRRTREFYRYYQPIRELTKSGPPLCDLADAASVRDHQAFSCPDRALTAFCQLGALRLQTRRCMLFFFDAAYAFVLAEATRTLSLQDDSVHELEDSLWLGHTKIPRGYSVCESTILLPPNQAKDDSTSMVNIINDLSEDTRFCDLPFVTDGPRARFYAGVPITTPKGINIGAYCVLDDKQRNGLDRRSMLFLRDMSATVMKHLEMVRGQAEHRIGTQMVAGLGAFIDGASGLGDWAEKNEDWNAEDHDAVSDHPMGTHSPKTSAVAQAAIAAVETIQEDQVPVSPAPPKPKHKRSRTVTASNGASLQRSAQFPTTLAGKRSSDNIKDPDTTDIQTTFKRAATLIREAMDVEGVLFFDSAVSTFGGLVDTVGTVSTELSSDHGSATEQTGTGTEGEEIMAESSAKEEVTSPKCCVLGSSCVPSPRKEAEVDRFTSVPPTQITEKFLRSLLRRYPRGKTWNFNEDGDASSDDEASSEYSLSADAKVCRCVPVNKSFDGKRPCGVCSKRRRRSRHEDAQEIARLFPGVRSLGLVGMWDHTRQRWYAACAFYTYSPLRLFSEESEIKYMSAFCDVILAELHRMEAQTSERAKSDFISTMSHELRSPLHGILGSVECLQETETDKISADLISQVDICGRTLLDIIDHLLDFSKINHHAKAKGGVLDAKGRRMSSNAARRSRMGGMMTLSADIALDQVTEEVVETAVYSAAVSAARDPAAIANRKVAVILEIDRSAAIDWKCYVAVGAWKRVCINLVSNALKYTERGHIRISLKASAIPEKRKRFNVTLSVTDTGRGMSRDFLENHLFRAFQQEDSFVEGTGLGMNLVAKIVKAFEGKIDVQSEQGVGTCFSITLPLEHSRNNIGRDPVRSPPLLGVSVTIIEPLTASTETSVESGRHLLLSSIQGTLEEAGAYATRCDWDGSLEADVYLVMEADVLQEMQRLQDGHFTSMRMSPDALSNKPFVVLCENAISQRRLRNSGLGLLASEHVELIAQPAGPERLAKAILNCMEKKRQITKATGLAGAVKDIPVVTPHPDRSAVSRIMAMRPSNPDIDSTYDEARLAPLHQARLPNVQGTADTMPRLKFQRSLSSQERLQRLPKTTLNSGIPTPGSQNTASAASKSEISLLLVDDNPINLRLLVTYAEKHGHHKIVATDGLQAVEAYKQACLDSVEPQDPPGAGESAISSSSKPQIILMDINMPRLNGFEATRQIRGFEEQRGIAPATIIALTGLGSATAQQEAFTSGFDLFLTKPVRLKELTKVIETLKKG